ncbi:MAG: peptidoglycan DD-metalloendopeptidase family protein [Desulfitobacterium hafniense]|nr:peptidoglycan DD-metalloendopeptidase family protein [Desulfitobacterium hafniense]
MNPFERWDDWEWEKAAREVGRERGIRSSGWEIKSERSQKGSKLTSLVNNFTRFQKRSLLAALMFLTVVFSAQGEDFISKGVYKVYRSAMGSGNYYASLNSMAKEVFSLGGIQTKSTPVDAKMQGKFLPPISGPVVAGFGQASADGKGTLHNGIDVSSSLGIPVVSPYLGAVTAVGEDPQLGKIVKLDLGDGWSATLGNLGDIYVKQGQKVEGGQMIGTIGLSAPLKKPWLHFELRKNGKPVDPLPYLVAPAK